MSEEIFLKGFNKMTASDRRLWLADIASGAFKILPDPGLEEGNDEDLDGAPITREGGQSRESDSEGEWAEAEEAMPVGTQEGENAMQLGD